MVEQFNIVYKNGTVDGSVAIKTEQELLRGSTVANLTDIDRVKQHVMDNFLQVHTV
jgi:hypothetical protein